MWLVGSKLPDQGLNPDPSAVRAQSPNQWPARVVPGI